MKFSRRAVLIAAALGCLAGILGTVGMLSMLQIIPAGTGTPAAATAGPGQVTQPGPQPPAGPDTTAGQATPSARATPSGQAAPSGQGAAPLITDAGTEPAQEEPEENDRDPSTAPGAELTARPEQAVWPESAPLSCPAPTVRVGTSQELQKALAAAKPGDVIGLADGIYAGRFVATASGEPGRKIFLCGGPGAVLDAGGPTGGYGFHLNGAKYWNLIGFTVRNGQKGVMADGTVGSVIQGLTVTDIGDEAIHLRRHSTDNVVAGNTIRNTGLRRPKFGEGIYIGTAESNWCSITGCEPDRSDRNVISGNDISGTTSESVDIKEGTLHGLLIGNRFDGSAITGADSWVDVKGTAWTIKDNHGENSPRDGFQTHDIVDGWGNRNLFTGNTAVVNGPGYGFAFRPALENIMGCDNIQQGAREGLSNIDCR